jgi:hypothetical protein
MRYSAAVINFMTALGDLERIQQMRATYKESFDSIPDGGSFTQQKISDACAILARDIMSCTHVDYKAPSNINLLAAQVNVRSSCQDIISGL